MTQTNISEVYETFLDKISDYTLLDSIEEEIKEDLLSYFKSARRKFRKCKSNLKYNESNGEFDSELDPYEIEILVTLMLVEYMKPKVVSSDTIAQSLSDKDFKIYSQANQLRELNLLYRMLRQEADKMMTQYTYFEIGEDNDK